jgi:hypothetical protein
MDDPKCGESHGGPADIMNIWKLAMELILDKNVKVIQ